ncbi:SDR family oxidoreductase [Sinimarinibacterium sp. CAU 1509]|uniref:SDR family oxidoreductase n=1 Tax=Sinimarinibacterium sp. CAU 1509 TaxID=2562283 RepID=UPI0010AD14DF|nr:SDR family NAD(P)-dependent oxidoreductase [Sinimarinibacterium sp. CAU 1509]TJY64885.1 SDR family oxidoreductase [Sinimarinibacterium sp. CAU 1509]
MSAVPSTVLITGAAGTLGRALAAHFDGLGAAQVLVDQDIAALQRSYPEPSARRWLVAANLLEADAVNAVAAGALERYGRIDAVCNIAGGFAMGPAVHETSAADWQKMQDINVGTLLNVVRAVVPALLTAGGGRIVNVAALGGLHGGAQMAAYSASKSAVIRITEAMSDELRERGINVNCVLPSIIDTAPNRAAMPDADPQRWVAPQDLASVIGFLCSDAARAVHGAAIPVRGLS